MIPAPPIALRNRLAETVLSALADPTARRQLESADLAWLEDVRPEQAALVRARARRAGRALAECPLPTASPSLEETLAAAAALFDAGLYFEVHELLEPYWAQATGEGRQALQGLIQIAVGFQHLANGNLEGARSLLAEGSRRLPDGDLPGVELIRFAEATAAAARGVGLEPTIVPKFPRAN